MSALRSLKFAFVRSLQFAGVFPSVWQIRNPFKIHEFTEVFKCIAPELNECALDLGCGGGIQTQLLAKNMREVTGVDLSAPSIENAHEYLRFSKVRSRVRFHCKALNELNLTSESLDAVYSFCVLEHIPELAVVLTEILRLLKKGGRLQVSVDSLGTIEDPVLIDKHRRDHRVHQYFTPDSLNEQLSRSGFEVNRIFPILTGPAARHEFEQRIRFADKGWTWPERIRLYRQFRAEDNVTRGERGIMLVAYARRR